MATCTHSSQLQLLRRLPADMPVWHEAPPPCMSRVVLQPTSTAGHSTHLAAAGPTLDDVTMAALAEAVDQRLTLHPQLEARIRKYFGANTTRAHLKMAEAPTGEPHTLALHAQTAPAVVALSGERALGILRHSRQPLHPAMCHSSHRTCPIGRTVPFTIHLVIGLPAS